MSRDRKVENQIIQILAELLLISEYIGISIVSCLWIFKESMAQKQCLDFRGAKNPE
jgi:hypothetical protein